MHRPNLAYYMSKQENLLTLWQPHNSCPVRRKVVVVVVMVDRKRGPGKLFVEIYFICDITGVALSIYAISSDFE